MILKYLAVRRTKTSVFENLTIYVVVKYELFFRQHNFQPFSQCRDQHAARLI